jgi:hypothetical protein
MQRSETAWKTAARMAALAIGVDQAVHVDSHALEANHVLLEKLRGCLRSIGANHVASARALRPIPTGSSQNYA